MIFITTFYFIYLFLWLRQNKFYQDPILSDNFPKWSRKLNKFTLAAIIFVVTASNITVAPHFFDPKVIICGVGPFCVGANLAVGDLHVDMGHG